MSERPAIAILARAPVAGMAKTRLAPALGSEGAAGLATWMLRRTLATARAAALGPLHLFCAGDPGHPEFLATARDGDVSLHPQIDGDLGARMLRAAETATNGAGVIVIGTDCPALTPALLHRVADELAHTPAVLIPAEDGGYVLIALRRAVPDVFDGIAWGGPDVMALTRERLRRLGWDWSEPATLWDVDRIEDVERLGRMLAQAGEPAPC